MRIETIIYGCVNPQPPYFNFLRPPLVADAVGTHRRVLGRRSQLLCWVTESQLREQSAPCIERPMGWEHVPSRSRSLVLANLQKGEGISLPLYREVPKSRRDGLLPSSMVMVLLQRRGHVDTSSPTTIAPARRMSTAVMLSSWVPTAGEGMKLGPEKDRTCRGHGRKLASGKDRTWRG